MSNLTSSKTVFKAKFFEVKEEEFERPKGKRNLHYYVQRKPIVAIFPITSSYEIYLIRQYRSLYKKYILEEVAGHVDENELPLDAAKRELKEETGIIANDWKKLTDVQISASVVKSNVHVFLAKDLKFSKATPEEGEDIEVVKMALDEAVEKVIKGEINVSIGMLGILMLDKLRKEKKI